MPDQCRVAANRLREFIGDPETWTDLDEVADFLSELYWSLPDNLADTLADTPDPPPGEGP